MTNKEILKKAIEKAVKNGWDWDGLKPKWWHVDVIVETNMGDWSVNDIVFNHDFAKAIFGEEPFGIGSAIDMTHGFTPTVPAWEYHIQQLATAENRLKYIESFL